MKKLLAGLVIFALVFVLVPPPVRSQDAIHDVEKEIDELRQKIEKTQSQQKTLNAEITAMNNRIRLTELQIAETTKKIAALGIEIEELTGKIDRLEGTLTHLSELLLNRIVTSYKYSRVSLVSLFFTANGLTDLLNRAKYIQLAQAHDRQVMTQVQSAKMDYSEQKDLREMKKKEQESLKLDLEIQKTSLDKQKKTKQALLEQTKNDESTYQKFLQQALSEKEALEAALISGVQVGPVKTGDPIAIVGNTGYPYCSTGAHLHFEVRRDNSWVNAGDYLKSKTVVDDQNGGTTTTGSGNWEWPLEGDIRVTQHYGQTPYSWRYTYSGGIHTGIDMVSDSSSVIRAPKDGILYSSSQTCGASTIKIKYIDHGGGIISFYLHVQ